MLEIDKNCLFFKTKQVYFSNDPFDIKNCQNIQFLYCKKRKDSNGFKQKQELTQIIDLTQELDTIFQEMQRNVKNHIRRAEREGVEIQISKNFDEFYDIYISLFKKKNIISFMDKFGIGKIIPKEIMEKYGTLFVAKYNGEVIVGDVYLEGEDVVFSWAGASKRLSLDKQGKKMVSRASRLCVWKAIEYYKNKGKKEFDLGGMWPIEQEEDDFLKKGINSYKRGFGGKLVTRYNYEKTYSKLYYLLSKINNIRNI